MNNIFKGRTSKEVIIQLERAEVQKNNLVQKIYKEYEIYFQIVRRSILICAEEGILGIYSDLPNNNRALNLKDLSNFFKKNISLLINSTLPLITIEQLKLEDTIHHSKQPINFNVLKKLVESSNQLKINLEYENDLITREPFEFHCNNNLNSYEHYESLSENKLSSLNLDEIYNLNFFSKKNFTKMTTYEEKNTPFHELNEEKNEEINDKNLNSFGNLNLNNEEKDFIPSDDLNIFEYIDKSFNKLLSNLSYSINSELFKINLINKIICEDTLEYLLTSSYLIKHPHPFVSRYVFNSNSISAKNKKSSSIYLLTINNIELEFFNLELSICRSKINELKNKFRLLNKKEKYWEKKEISKINLK